MKHGSRPSLARHQCSRERHWLRQLFIQLGFENDLGAQEFVCDENRLSGSPRGELDKRRCEEGMTTGSKHDYLHDMVGW